MAESFLAVNPQQNFLTKDISLIACYDHCFEQSRSSYIDQYLQKLAVEINKSLIAGYDKTLLLTLVWETGDPDYWKHSLQEFLHGLKKTCDNLKIILILDTWYQPFQLNFAGTNETFYVDFFLYRTFEATSNHSISEPVSTWDANLDKILFIVGKPNKIHRTRLLYKFLNSEIKSDLSWSYRINENNLNETLVYLSDITSEKQREFLASSQRGLDEFSGSNLSGLVKNNSDLYKNCLLQIVSETWFERPLIYPFITEKTWMAIANHRPFIVAGEFGHSTRLKNLGICTFQDYLPLPNHDDPDSNNFLQHSDVSNQTGFFLNLDHQTHWKNFYDNIKDPTWPVSVEQQKISILPRHAIEEIREQYRFGVYSWSEIRLDAIVENAIFFKKNAGKYANQIQENIDHNVKQFKIMGSNSRESLNDLCIRQKLCCNHLYDIFEDFPI